MKRPQAEEILGEWGVRDVTPPSQREREQVTADLDLNPLVGRPLRRRLRNFRAEHDNYLASVGGSLPNMRHLRETAAPIESQLEPTEEAAAERTADIHSAVEPRGQGQYREL